MYPNYYQPMQQNPYRQQLEQQWQNQWQMQQKPQYGQNTMPQMQMNYLSGRYINNPKEIMANEVPMDGSAGFFPTSDQKFIYAKAWNADGKIETGVYKLVEETENTNTSGPDTNAMFIADVTERLERIEKMLSPQSQIKTTARKKGEISDD